MQLSILYCLHHGLKTIGPNFYNLHCSFFTVRLNRHFSLDYKRLLFIFLLISTVSHIRILPGAEPWIGWI